MPIHPAAPDDAIMAFLADRHLATLTTLRRNGTPHVVPVGFTYDPATQLARVITRAGSRKVANVEAHPGGRAAVCQVDGGRWLTLEGPAEVSDGTERVAEAVKRYAARYRQPEERDDRVVVEISVDRIMGRA